HALLSLLPRSQTLKCPGDGYPDHSGLNVSKAEGRIRTQPSGQHASPVSQVVRIEIGGPGVGTHAEVKVDLGVGRVNLTHGTACEFAQPFAHVTHGAAYKTRELIH